MRGNGGAGVPLNPAHVAHVANPGLDFDYLCTASFEREALSFVRGRCPPGSGVMSDLFFLFLHAYGEGEY